MHTPCTGIKKDILVRFLSLHLPSGLLLKHGWGKQNDVQIWRLGLCHTPFSIQCIAHWPSMLILLTWWQNIIFIIALAESPQQQYYQLITCIGICILWGRKQSVQQLGLVFKYYVLFWPSILLHVMHNIERYKVWLSQFILNQL